MWKDTKEGQWKLAAVELRLTMQIIVLEFGNVSFWGEGKTGVPGEKPLEQRREPKKTQPA